MELGVDLKQTAVNLWREVICNFHENLGHIFYREISITCLFTFPCLGDVRTVEYDVGWISDNDKATRRDENAWFSYFMPAKLSLTFMEENRKNPKVNIIQKNLAII